MQGWENKTQLLEVLLSVLILHNIQIPDVFRQPRLWRFTNIFFLEKCMSAIKIRLMEWETCHLFQWVTRAMELFSVAARIFGKKSDPQSLGYSWVKPRHLWTLCNEAMVASRSRGNIACIDTEYNSGLQHKCGSVSRGRLQKVVATWLWGLLV